LYNFFVLIDILDETTSQSPLDRLRSSKMAHDSIAVLSLVLAFNSLLVTAQSTSPILTPENGGGSGAGTGGGAPPVATPSSSEGTIQGASGGGSGINISKGALIAIIVVIAGVAIIGSKKDHLLTRRLLTKVSRICRPVLSREKATMGTP
jgi:hypothetical protein